MQNPEAILVKIHNPVFIEKDGKVICNLFRPNDKPTIMEDCVSYTSIGKTFYAYDMKMRAAAMALAVVWQHHKEFAEKNSVQRINPMFYQYIYTKALDNPVSILMKVIEKIIKEQVEQ